LSLSYIFGGVFRVSENVCFYAQGSYGHGKPGKVMEKEKEEVILRPGKFLVKKYNPKSFGKIL